MTENNYTEEEIELAIKVHDCSREEAIQTYCEQIKLYRQNQKIEYEKTLYMRKRSSEYPPITDYLDGIVKNDQAQIDKYISDCLAVKEKYPKPE